MKIHKLTEEQKDLLVNKMFIKNNYFNPIQDANNNWVVSIEEVDMCNVEEFMWVKELELIEFEPVINEDFDGYPNDPITRF